MNRLPVQTDIFYRYEERENQTQFHLRGGEVPEIIDISFGSLENPSEAAGGETCKFPKGPYTETV